MKLDVSQIQPNVLLVLTDQQSGDMLSAAGNPYLDTPAMDRLADSGIRFERAYCANPECSPSRTSIFTGRYASAIDQWSNDDSHIDHVPDSIAELGLGHTVRAAGYEAVYAGKDHLPSDLSIERLGFNYLTADERDGCVDACIDYLESDPDDPFCLVASPINPHDICYMAIRDARENSDQSLLENETAEGILDAALDRPEGVDEESFFEDYAPPLPENHEPQTDEPGAIDAHLDERPFKRYIREEWSAERWREHRWAYARLTELVDAQIGRLLDTLEETGLREETVVIFTSDHGDMDGAHRLEHKSVLYEEAVRVPLLISDPRGPSEQVDDRLVSLLDVLPTICDYANGDPPSEADGRSLHPLIHGEDAEDRSYVRIESRLGEAIVGDRFKYALYDTEPNREQLYDLDTDPGEMQNHADEHPDVFASMRCRLIDGSAIDHENAPESA
jgi:choline-sulfatase